MEFKISRASLWDNKKPCEEARKCKYIREDERGFASPDNFKERLHEDWYSKGFNHRFITNKNDNFVNDTHIIRDFLDEGWFIEINTIGELLDLEKKYGDLIIRTSYENKNIYEIEIYDDYIE